MEGQFAGVEIELRVGDIAEQGDCQAVINAANAELAPGGGVAGALHSAAGPELAQACRPLAPIAPGEAVITEGFALPNAWVIHCLGPVFGVDEPSADLLADCYRNALRLAEENAVSTLATPAISTGDFCYPMDQAARVAMEVIAAVAPELQSVTKIRFVLPSQRACDVHQRMLDEVLEEVA